jgi:hypothetical protein
VHLVGFYSILGCCCFSWSICLGDGGGNYSRLASSRTLDSRCVDGVCTGKLRAVVCSEINVFLCVCVCVCVCEREREREHRSD